MILHVDMDAFFAAVEIRDQPTLGGKPVLVGGTGSRGVVAAASYEARKFGCKSAQPMVEARRRCPQAIVLPPRRSAYIEASRRVFSIFERFSPRVEALSIDEAFLDVTGEDRLFGSARQIADEIRREVKRETELTCSVGAAAVKFIAKIASAKNKPDGYTEVPPGTEVEFLEPLPIGTLWGVGPQTEAQLRRHEIGTIGDLRRLGEPRLQQWFGQHGVHLHRLSCGIDPREVVPGAAAKSISHEDTYGTDIRGARAIRRKLLDQSVRVADRLVAAGLRGRVVALKIRDGSFRTETRQCTLSEPTDEARTIYRAACALLEQVELSGRGFRLTGVGVRDFGPAASQLQLGFSGEQGSLQAVLSAVRSKFGERALYPAEAEAERTNATGAVTHRPDR